MKVAAHPVITGPAGQFDDAGVFQRPPAHDVDGGERQSEVRCVPPLQGMKDRLVRYEIDEIAAADEAATADGIALVDADFVLGKFHAHRR